MRKRIKKVSKLYYVLITFLLIASNAFAQTTVTGKITDSKDGTGLQGVTVAVRGSQNAVKTGSDGSFKISVPANASSLLITSVGYESQQVSVIGQSSINILLVQTSSRLNDVVVIAYGSRRRGDLTGSITSVS